MPRLQRLIPAALLCATLVSPARAATAPSDEDTVRDQQTPSPGGAGSARARIENGDFSLAFRGFGQFHAVPWTGEDARLDNGDAAQFPGFRVRRMSLGLDGRLGTSLRFDVWLDLAAEPLFSQARIAWVHSRALTVEAGVVSVPFTASAMQSSAEIAFSERPIAVQGIVPDRQPGLAAYGALGEDFASWRVGVFNASEVGQASRGNDHPGALLGGRFVVTPSGALRPGQEDFTRGDLRWAVGLSGFGQQAAGYKGFAGGVDATLQVSGFAMMLEGLFEQRDPLSQPAVSPGLPGRLRRFGAVGQASYVLFEDGPALAVRGELSDDNTGLQDVGDMVGVAAGVHHYISGLDLRVALDFYHRTERHGRSLSNDAVVLSTQGRF